MAHQPVRGCPLRCARGCPSTPGPSLTLTACCLCPSTSTHRQMTDEQLKAAGIPAGLVRISCGLEAKEDLVADLKQALE